LLLSSINMGKRWLAFGISGMVLYIFVSNISKLIGIANPYTHLSDISGGGIGLWLGIIGTLLLASGLVMVGTSYYPRYGISGRSPSPYNAGWRWIALLMTIIGICSMFISLQSIMSMPASLDETISGGVLDQWILFIAGILSLLFALGKRMSLPLFMLAGLGFAFACDHVIYEITNGPIITSYWGRIFYLSCFMWGIGSLISGFLSQRERLLDSQSKLATGK
jgi:hypothetical protein